MKIEAKFKYARMSAKKLRDISRVLRNRSAADALSFLKFSTRKSARLIFKTLSSAVANAENNSGLLSSNLLVDNVLIEEGPAFKRFMPAARGSAHPIRKRTSHIRVILKQAKVEKR
ncbi:MAG: 50S ribosomal protein L22 [Puniceicoccales bacterium]|jgi:large subunit ribosomal protein L22|nr:50S ribosomal protein L22 [Puniceicoccales bacterium]